MTFNIITRTSLHSRQLQLLPSQTINYYYYPFMAIMQNNLDQVTWLFIVYLTYVTVLAHT